MCCFVGLWGLRPDSRRLASGSAGGPDHGPCHLFAAARAARAAASSGGGLNPEWCVACAQCPARRTRQNIENKIQNQYFFKENHEKSRIF